MSDEKTFEMFLAQLYAKTWRDAVAATLAKDKWYLPAVLALTAWVFTASQFSGLLTLALCFMLFLLRVYREAFRVSTMALAYGISSRNLR